jgi:hypothetical protein
LGHFAQPAKSSIARRQQEGKLAKKRRICGVAWGLSQAAEFLRVPQTMRETGTFSAESFSGRLTDQVTGEN